MSSHRNPSPSTHTRDVHTQGRQYFFELRQPIGPVMFCWQKDLFLHSPLSINLLCLGSLSFISCAGSKTLAVVHDTSSYLEYSLCIYPDETDEHSPNNPLKRSGKVTIGSARTSWTVTFLFLIKSFLKVCDAMPTTQRLYFRRIASYPVTQTFR